MRGARARRPGPRGEAGRPHRLGALELATLEAARALHLGDEVGSLALGSAPTSTLVALAGSPYLPWEDPAAAVVFGGSQDRVLLTLVDGEERYRKGGSDGTSFVATPPPRARAYSTEKQLAQAPSQ
jgi:cytosine/adenosine deaminase-related metal-dependent hydrolase